MNCKFCGRKTEYAHFQDGTVCCELCNKEKARLLRENVRMKMKENNRGRIIEELNLETLLYENSLIQGEMYGGDVKSMEGLYVALGENGHIRVYEEIPENIEFIALSSRFEVLYEDKYIIRFRIREIEYKQLFTFTKNQFARFNDNMYYKVDEDEVVYNKERRYPSKEKANESIVNETDKFDPVTKPMHYNSTNIETRKVNRDITSDKPGDEAGPVFNIVKYISRYNKKNGIQDVEKVTFYSLELLSILLDKEGLSKNEISEYIYNLLDKYKPQFAPDRLSVFKD